MAFKMQYMVKIFFCIAEITLHYWSYLSHFRNHKAFIIFIHVSTSSVYTDEVVVSNKRSFEALKRFFTNFSRGFCDSNILRKTLVNLLTLATCTLGPARACCLAIPFQFNSLHILLVLVGPGSLDLGPIPISPLISHNLQALSSLTAMKMEKTRVKLVFIRKLVPGLNFCFKDKTKIYM